MNTRYKLVLTI